jgi:hypothetical protein
MKTTMLVLAAALLAALALSGPARAGDDPGAAPRRLRVFDVRDVPADDPGVQRVIDEITKQGAEVQRTKGALVVRCTAAQADVLGAALRKARGDRPFLVAGGGGTVVVKKFGPVVMGKRAAKTGGGGVGVDKDGRLRVKAKGAFKLDGVRILGLGTKDGHVRVSSSWQPLAVAHEAAMAHKADQLQQAARLLEQAGEKADAARYWAEADKLRTQAATLRKARVAAERAAAERARASAASAGRTAGVQDDLRALRQDVASLRKEVRELTGLVRQLLAARRDR